jgi:hypothetical protein
MNNIKNENELGWKIDLSLPRSFRGVTGHNSITVHYAEVPLIHSSAADCEI